jgi:tetratricopeptide (TPR) repeat protein
MVMARVTWLVMALALSGCTARVGQSTPTPSQLPPPTATPEPTPTPTPSPADHLARGETALFNGDWDAALEAFGSAADSGAAVVGEQGELGRARLLIEAGRPEEALSALDFFLIAHPEGDSAAQAHLLRALVRRGRGEAAAAVEDFDAYRSMHPGVIDGYVQEWAADALWDAGQPQAAAERYLAAAGLARLDDGTGVRFKAGRALVEADDPTASLAIYDSIYQATIDPAVRAAANWYAGQALQAMGDDASAYARYLESVTNYPDEHETYLALVELVNADVPVDDFLRGRIDLIAEAYEPAVAAFTRVVESQPSSTAYYLRALSRRGAGDPLGAMDDLFQVYTGYADAPEREEAWLEAADIARFDLGDARQAIGIYQQFVDALPTSPRAPQALFSAGRAAELSGDLPGWPTPTRKASRPATPRCAAASANTGWRILLERRHRLKRPAALRRPLPTDRRRRCGPERPSPRRAGRRRRNRRGPVPPPAIPPATTLNAPRTSWPAGRPSLPSGSSPSLPTSGRTASRPRPGCARLFLSPDRNRCRSWMRV